MLMNHRYVHIIRIIVIWHSIQFSNENAQIYFEGWHTKPIQNCYSFRKNSRLPPFWCTIWAVTHHKCVKLFLYGKSSNRRIKNLLVKMASQKDLLIETRKNGVTTLRMNRPKQVCSSLLSNLCIVLHFLMVSLYFSWMAGLMTWCSVTKLMTFILPTLKLKFFSL